MDMNRTSPKPSAACFGLFEADFGRRVLTKGGLRVRLQEQPFRVLEMLLESPGELVGREEIRQRLWPSDTFVEFDDGLNTAIKKLRAALGDSAENPRFIETIPRRGYRFLAPVSMKRPAIQPRDDSKQSAPVSKAGGEPESVGRAGSAEETNGEAAGATAEFPRARRAWMVALGSVAGAAIVLALAWIAWIALGTHEFSRSARKKISLAVLPLEDLSAEHSEEYLSEGLTDELITDLAKLPGFRVISRTSTMQYKETRKTVPQIARELGVDEVVEGTVLRSGNRMRVRVQLIQGRTDEHVWAEAYERDVRDILSLESEVARSVAAQINRELAPQGGAPLREARPVNFEAYSAYLKGRYEWNKRTAESLKKSVEYFEKSIQGDPGYAEAHEGLAEVYSILPDYDVMPAEDSYPRAKAEALKALELDPALGEAHATLAVVKEELDWDWSGAAQEFERALELGPASATTHQWYSEYLLRVGRSQESIGQIQQALELDPASPLMNAESGAVLYWAREYDAAIQQLKKAIEMEPRFPYAHSWLGFAYEQKGMRQEAIREFQKAVAVSGGSAFFRAALAYAEGLAGNEGAARKIFADLKGISGAGQAYVSPYDFALIHLGLGERKDALQALEQTVAAHDTASDFLKSEPALDSLRADPKFRALMERVRLNP
jgi:TolB-like protein/DNA-binding winged helix-turn-helix (wHTH) protein/Tfp pilus assembly protein PilF